jgi:hypothetical protein
MDAVLQEQISSLEMRGFTYIYLHKENNSVGNTDYNDKPLDELLENSIVYEDGRQIFKVDNHNIENYTLFLLYENKIIGFIKADDIKNKVYIDYIELNNLYRKRGLCKEIMKLFICNVNFYNNYNSEFYLMNLGGKTACKCYIDAFDECNYDTFIKVKFEKPEKIYSTSCNEQSTYFNFIPRNQNAGQKKKKLTKRKLTKRKTKKRQSNKYLLFRRQK